MSRETVNPIILHNMLHQVIKKIDKKEISYEQFQFEPLFINLYYCFYFSKYLSPYYSWSDKVITLLKRNIRKKWRPALPNVDFFFQQMERSDTQIDPFDYWFHSEDYFQKLCALKSTVDILFPIKKKEKKKKNKYVKKYKPIR